MPEITAVLLAILALLFALGVVLGWFLRSDRSAREKIAINAGWQEQMEVRHLENERLSGQNKGLLQQINELQASHADTAQRTRELSASLKDAVRRRDELQRQIKDVRAAFEHARTDLERATASRGELEADLRNRDNRDEAAAKALREKDNKIFKLSRELSSWQSRVPPLVERFRQKDRELGGLRDELDQATDRIVELEAMTRRAEETQIEPVDRNRLAEGLDACNDQYDDTSWQDLTELEDQIADRNGPANVFAAIVGNGRDDLQKIKGVGPAIERTLNELGIFRFDQIARIGEFDIDRIAERLRGFRSRIYREDWIGQAQTLLLQRDGGPAELD